MILASITFSIIAIIWSGRLGIATRSCRSIFVCVSGRLSGRFARKTALKFSVAYCHKTTFDLTEGESQFVVGFEIGNEMTRSNDGRADPHGGFWIGTMGKNGEAKARSIYRYYKGELKKLYQNITTTNSICFAPSGDVAYFCDTRLFKIMSVDLDDDGRPFGEPKLFVD